MLENNINFKNTDEIFTLKTLGV